MQKRLREVDEADNGPTALRRLLTRLGLVAIVLSAAIVPYIRVFGGGGGRLGDVFMGVLVFVVLGVCGQQLLRIVAPSTSSRQSYWSLLVVALLISMGEVFLCRILFARLSAAILPSAAPVRLVAYPNVAMAVLVAMLSGGPAAGDDDTLRLTLSLIGEETEAPGFPEEALHLAAGLHPDARRRQGIAKHVHDASRRVRKGVDPPVRLRDRHQSEPEENLQSLRGTEALQSRGGKTRRLSVVMLRRSVGIREVAAPVPGNSQLSSHPGLAFIDRDCGAPGGGRKRRHHPGGAAADHSNGSHGSLPIINSPEADRGERRSRSR